MAYYQFFMWKYFLLLCVILLFCTAYIFYVVKWIIDGVPLSSPKLQNNWPIFHFNTVIVLFLHQDSSSIWMPHVLFPLSVCLQNWSYAGFLLERMILFLPHLPQVCFRLRYLLLWFLETGSICLLNSNL